MDYSELIRDIEGQVEEIYLAVNRHGYVELLGKYVTMDQAQEAAEPLEYLIAYIWNKTDGVLWFESFEGTWENGHGGWYHIKI